MTMNKNQLNEIFEKYFEVLKYEMEVLNCKPTELRHLIGRLGEFHCAIKTEGQLAHTPNQHGFDVISKEGKKISVKTTAQKTGFISLNKKTLNLFDELMVIQLVGLDLVVICHDKIKEIEPLCRTWKGDLNKYELDLSKIKKNYA